MKSLVDLKEKFPIKNDEESSLVDKKFEISNHDLFQAMEDFVRLKEIL